MKMTDYTKQFGTAKRTVGYRKAMQEFKPVNLAQVFGNMGVVFNNSAEDILNGQDR